MGLVQAVVLGVVQGLTEFLPISSSGHLFLVPDLLGWEDAGAGFTAVIQLGTMFAVLIYFWHDLRVTLAGWLRGFKDPAAREGQEWKLGWAIAVGTLPVCVAGLLLEKKIDTVFRSAYLIASTLIGLGLLLWVAEILGKRQRTLAETTWKDGLVMGLWQCLALVPGSSRSGSTITGGLFSGFERATAARLSFLLSVPAVVLSGLYKLVKDRSELMGSGAVPTVVATVVAFATGLAAISFLMKFLQTRSTFVFVVYRVVLGVVILVLVATGRVHDRAPLRGAEDNHGVLQATEHA